MFLKEVAICVHSAIRRLLLFHLTGLWKIGWLIELGIALEDFFPPLLAEPKDGQPPGHLQHLISWWEQRHNPDVLLLCYEDMLADLPDTVRKIAAFMRIKLDDELFNIVVRQSSREFMLTHKQQFDEKYLREFGEQRVGLPPNGNFFKVTSNSSSEKRYQIPQSMQEQFDQWWHGHIQPKFGLRNYGELR